MNLAQQDWEAGNTADLRQMLAATRDSPERGFEWDFWQRLTHLDLLTLRQYTAGIACAAYSPDGGRIVTCSEDGKLKMWDTASGAMRLSVPSDLGYLVGVAFSPDGQRLAVGCASGVVKVFDARTGRELLTLDGHQNPVYGLAFSRDGRRLYTGSQERVVLWDCATGRILRSFPIQGDAVVAFSPDRSRCASGHQIYDTVTGRVVVTTQVWLGRSIAFSPDGRRVAVPVSTDAVVLDATTGRKILTLRGHTSWVWAVAYSPHGRCLLTAGGDTTARIWDASTGEPLLTLKGHRGRILAASFSPDGRRVLTAGADGVSLIHI